MRTCRNLLVPATGVRCIQVVWSTGQHALPFCFYRTVRCMDVRTTLCLCPHPGWHLIASTFRLSWETLPWTFMFKACHLLLCHMWYQTVSRTSWNPSLAGSWETAEHRFYLRCLWWLSPSPDVYRTSWTGPGVLDNEHILTTNPFHRCHSFSF